MLLIFLFAQTFANPVDLYVCVVVLFGLGFGGALLSFVLFCFEP